MKLTVYDFDGTIYDGDSSIDFIKFLIKKDKTILFMLPKMFIYLLKYKMKLINKEKMKEVFFSPLNKFKDIDIIIEEFWETHNYKIKPFFKDKITHKNDIIASASPEFLLIPIKEKYNILDLIASPIDKTTGKYHGINCRGSEKVRLIETKYPNDIIYEMYSDDIVADGPLLNVAKKSYVVKKNNIIDYNEYKKKKPNFIKRFWNWGWSIYHKNEEIWNYLIVGGLTTLVSLIVYYICVKTFLDPSNNFELQCANIISWIISVAFAYVTNRIFVFKSKEKNIKKEATSFVASRISTLLLDMLTMFILVSTLHINDKIGKIISQVFVIIGNYIISKLFVFKNKA